MGAERGPWSKGESGVWVAEASGLRGESWPRCPECRQAAAQDGVDRDGEGEVQGWRFVCARGHRLLVIND